MEFIYRVQNQSGEALNGNIEAPSQDKAIELLHDRGFVVLSLHPAAKDLFSADINDIFARPKAKDTVIFTRQLATLIEADMPLAEGLRTLAKQVDKPALKKIIANISDAVEGGSSLSVALAEYPKLFSPFYLKLIRSGELSGKLHDSLSYLADYLERTQAITSKIKGALAYPAFVIAAMIIVVIIMIVYVLPQLLVILKEAGIENLPISTRILLFVTETVNNYLYAFGIAIIGAGVAIWRYVRTEAGKEWMDKVKIQVPVFGKILSALYLARIAESLATLIKSGISILDAIKITAELVDNRTYQAILLEAEEEVRGGGSMSETLSRYHEVPALMTSMMAIGERTGKMDSMLGHVSKFYRDESETAIQSLSQLIEPILMLVLGVGVAILVASILLPIYSLVGAS